MSELKYIGQLQKYFYYFLLIFCAISALNLYYCQFIFNKFLLAIPNAHLLNFVSYKLIAPLWLPMKFSLWISLICSAPVALILLWRFIRPALYQSEQRKLRYMVSFCIFLFISGVSFAYCIIIPTLIHFIYLNPHEAFHCIIDIENYCNFVCGTLLLFGLCFQLPILLKLLIQTKIVSADKLKTNRKLIFLLAFIFGMLLTPPDIISQILLAVPLYLLFEIGLCIA